MFTTTKGAWKHAAVLQMAAGRFVLIALAAALGAGFVSRAPAQTLLTNQIWHYRLTASSTYSDQCLVCGLVTPPLPMRGSFDLVLAGQNPLNTTYTLTNINFTAGSDGTAQDTVTGSGTWQTGGEVAITQKVTLVAAVQTPGGIENLTFTNSVATPEVLWPTLEVDLYANLSVNQFHLHLVASPFREIWFTTGQNFEAGSGAGAVKGGDVISDTGRLVKSQTDLVAALGLPAGGYTVDALDVAQGGAVLFSLNEDVTSPAAGPLRNGGLVSDQGRVVLSNAALTTAFGLAAPVPDLGLKGAQLLDSGETYFSITSDTLAPRLGIKLTHGDVLSSLGYVVRSNQALLSRFQPKTPGNLGLQTFHVWPGGETWFSVETGFTDVVLGAIGAGDLLSDQGYIVFRYADLTQAFAPAQTFSSNSLTGLFVVTDTAAPEPAPQLLSPAVDAVTGNVTVDWTAKGRVFEVWKTSMLGSSFLPVSQIVPGTNWVDIGGALGGGAGFYRLRQW